MFKNCMVVAELCLEVPFKCAGKVDVSKVMVQNCGFV